MHSLAQHPEQGAPEAFPRSVHPDTRRGESRGEAAHFATCVQNARFGNLAGAEFQTFTNRDSDILAPHLMADVAAEGDSSDAIGLAVSDGISEGNNPRFGGLHRDSQWMGLQPLLGMLKGKEAWVFPSNVYRDRRGSVVAGPPGSLKHRGVPGVTDDGARTRCCTGQSVALHSGLLARPIGLVGCLRAQLH